MGSIRVREGRYQANVRRKGYAPVTATFTSREVAKRFIKSTEIAMERGFNVMEVASITGHENLKHLKRYTHIKPESLVARLG